MDKILIIDDDKSMLDTLELYLADSDYKIFFANGGAQGINILEQEHPDIVISDVMMPEINGLDVLIKSKKFDQNINVIMLTAFDDMESTIKAIQLGAYDYLSKPIEQERLKIIIKRALRIFIGVISDKFLKGPSPEIISGEDYHNLNCLIRPTIYCWTFTIVNRNPARLDDDRRLFLPGRHHPDRL